MKRGLHCTLATGESLYSRFEFLRLLQVRGADIIQPDICVVGGLMEMRKIAALAEAHYVTVAPHNPMGPLATAVNLHFCAAPANFRILEYRLPHGPGYVFGTGQQEAPSTDQRLQGAWYVKDPYLPKDGYLELRPDRARLGCGDGHGGPRQGGLRPLGAQGAGQAGRVHRVCVRGGGALSRWKRARARGTC